jgi:predicted amidohydrolase YtcJ
MPEGSGVGWGAHRLDERFADMVLMPGLVEGHSHLMEGTFWRYVYCGFFDRTDPGGKVWPGVKSIEAVVERLREAAAALGSSREPVSGWALDPIYFGNACAGKTSIARRRRARSACCTRAATS